MTRERTRTPAVVALFVLLAAGTLLATSPDRIRLSYGDSSRTLTIMVHHPTLDPASHYVAAITIRLNDSLLAVQRFSNQTNKQEQNTQCTIPKAQPGDRLTVHVICRLYGQRSETLIVPSFSPQTSLPGRPSHRESYFPDLL